MKKTMLVPNSEMLRANPHLQADLGRDYTASVASAQEAIALADKLGISYFDLDGVFYGRTAKRWNAVR